MFDLHPVIRVVRGSALAVVSLLLVACGGKVSNGTVPTSPTPIVNPTPVPSPASTLDAGDGHSGDHTIDSPSVINTCTSLILTGSATLEVASAAGIAVGDRVMLIQMQADFQSLSGETSTTTAASGAGSFELARVASVSGNVITAQATIAGDYATNATGTAQLCVVPEFENLTVTATGLINASAWDGSSGGIVAVMVRDTFTLNNGIDAGASGFRGGIVQPDHQATDQEAEDYAAGEGGGKGEGLDLKSYLLAGRGVLANGGGGGNGRDGGGGGGGNGGAGGFGGKQTQGQSNNSNVRGRPGGTIVIAGALTAGAGGGAGHQSDTTAGAGANGGGIVFVVAQRLTGTGFMSAAGADGADSENDGAGGGGAGGTIWVQAAESDWAGMIAVRGGEGGNELDTGNRRGPGGGGGGGRLLVAGVPDATLQTDGGANGVCPGFDDDPHSATPGQGGSVQLLTLD